MTIQVFDWNELDVHIVTNLYLYGATTTPENYVDRLRSQEEYSSLPTYTIDGITRERLPIEITMNSFMEDGPGRFARPSQAAGIEYFFEQTGPGASLVNNTYTKGELIASHGFTQKDFEFTLIQYQIAPEIDDYAARTYITNSIGFEISDDAVFVVDGSSRYISQMAVHAFFDDFDFQSDDFWTQIGNGNLGEDIDPFNIGRQVQFQITGKENVPTWNELMGSDYNASNYAAHKNYVDNLPSGNLFDARDAMDQVLLDLKTQGTIDYETTNGLIIYGTNGADVISGTAGNDIIISGGATGSGDTINLSGGGADIDIVNAGDGNDTIVGNSTLGDTYNGGNGIDTIDYSDFVVDAYGYGLEISIENSGNGTAENNSTYYDTFTSIENIIGTHGDDYINGNSGNNFIDGNGGGDFIQGHGGADVFVWNPNYYPHTSFDNASFIIDVISDDIIQLEGITTDDLIFLYNDSFVEDDGIIPEDNYNFGIEIVAILPSQSDPVSWDDNCLVFTAENFYFDVGGPIDYYSIDPYYFVKFQNPDGTIVSFLDLLSGAYSSLDLGGVYGGDNDLIVGTNGADSFSSGGGDDNVSTGDGNDRIYSGVGNDIIQGGSGSDLVQAGKGDDVVSYVYQENTESSDTYFGQQGIDQLNFYFSSTELSFEIKSELVAFRNYLSDVSNIDTNAASGVFYDFASFNLSVSRFETFSLYVNGVATSIAINAQNDDFSATVNSAISGNLLVNNGHGADTGFLSPVFANAGTFTTAEGGIIVINTDGSFIYTPSIGFTGVDTFLYTANDGQGTIGTATASFNINSVSAINGTSGNDTLNGTTGNDVLNGLGGNDTLNGLAGNDTLDGGIGNDTMVGSTGDDTYIVDSASDVVTEGASAGADTVRASINYTLGTNFENLILTGSAALNGTGNTFANTITGNSGNNTLDGSTGVDTLIGGLGNDLYIVDNALEVITENANEGNDTVQTVLAHTLSSNVENLTLTGTGSVAGTGNALDNIITGNSGNNTLTGNGGNDTLNGGTGNDTMNGGQGDDTYVINVAADVVNENVNEGTDTVQSAVTYTLTANVENLTLTGTSAINATGNTADNILVGNSAVNTLNGSTGNDTMSGGTGNDIYVVDSVLDVIIENNGEGTDLVQSSVTYSLVSNVENLTLTGTSAIDGNGNELNNTLTGNTGNNILNGGIGNDTMIGGTGNDTYIIDSALDVVTEAANAGTDVIIASVTIAALAANVENINLAGSSDISVTGNALNNIITGNGGNNTLNGGAGNDTMIGGLGNDIYVVDSSSDIITENSGEGADTIQSSITLTSLVVNVENLTLTGTGAINGTGNALNNILNGNTGANILDGGVGIDTLAGGAGNDTYILNDTDTLIENTGEGTDTVNASISYTLLDNFENILLIGSSSINATGNSLNNTLTGNSANNILDGGIGNDTMIGGLGDDTYIVDSSSDVVTEAASAGTDTIRSSVTITALATNVENLILTGISIANGTGNALNNVLTGNSNSNILSGGAGADTMIGGQGNDTYVVDNISDIIIEYISEGIDGIQSSVSYFLGEHLENLYLQGSGAISGTGNNLNNVIAGNSGNNTLYGGDGNDTLDGGTGTDTLIGGLGNDTYRIDSTSDIVTEGSNEGIDLLTSQITITLMANVENLKLNGTSAGDQPINGTGNSLDNVIEGNEAANILSGMDGNDTLYGRGGNDTLSGGNHNDTLFGGTGADSMTGGSGTDTFGFLAVSAFTNVDTVTDFNLLQSDRLDVSDLLTGYTIDASNINDFVTITAVGSNSSLLIDRDGTGSAYSDQAIATLIGVTGQTVDQLFNNGYLIA